MSPTLHAAHLALLDQQARLPSAAYVLISLAVLMTKWDRYRRTRVALKTLDPHLLADIGLSKGAAHNEVRKWFWQD